MLRRRTIGLLAVLVAAAAMSGCSEDPPPPEAAPGAAAPRNPAADFTAAVPLDGAKPGTRLQFQLGGRPEVGKPLQLLYRLVPEGPVKRLQVAFEAESGLGFVDELRATLVLDAAGAASGEPHELNVLPASEGVLLLRASVLTESDRGTQSVDFAIPVLVGAPPAPAEAAAAPAAAPPAAPAPPAG